MANIVTLSRLLLLVPLVWLAYQPPSPWQLINVPLMLIIFLMDGLDGYVARKRGETSLFGAMFDIAADRVVELTMWIVAADLDLVPIWVPLVVVVRAVAIDAIRSSAAASSRTSPFDLADSPIARWLIGGRFMRVSYAVAKAVAFTLLLLILPLPALYPEIWSEHGRLLDGLAAVFVYTSVFLCLLRGAPVVAEFLSGVHSRA